MPALRARRIFGDEGQTVIVVESFDIRCGQGDAMFWLSGRSEPVAIVVSGPDSACAVDIAGQAIDLDPLLVKTPGLRALLGFMPETRATS
jgi:hypothetical protein